MEQYKRRWFLPKKKQVSKVNRRKLHLMEAFVVILVVIVVALIDYWRTTRIIFKRDDIMIINSIHFMSMPDEYRKITGRDSIQLIVNKGQLEAVFCYPNEHDPYK